MYFPYLHSGEDIDDFTDIKFVYLNSLVYDPNIFQSSSKVFSNLWKPSEFFGKVMFSNVYVTFRQVLENFWNVSRNPWKILKKAILSILKRTLHVGSKI